MTEDIKSLIEKINQEGVEAAEAKAGEIQKQAERQAEEILTRARKEAERLVAEAAEKIKAMDLTYYRWVTLHLRDRETKIVLTYDNFAQKLKYYFENHNALEERFGPLEYVDLRFQNRLYIKPQKNINGEGVPELKKEAL